MKISNHAEQRINERLGYLTVEEQNSLVNKAFLEGKEWYQLPFDSLERGFVYQKSKVDGYRVVYFDNAIFVFGKDNNEDVLVTLYKPSLPTTTLYELNYKWLCKHVLDSQYWFVSWKLFQYTDATLDASLIGINFKTRMFQLELIAKFPHKEDDDKSNNLAYASATVEFPLNHPEYTELIFKRKIISAYRQLCIKAAREDIKLSKEYSEYKRDDDIKLFDAQRQAESFCNMYHIDDKILRKDIIERYKTKAKANEAVKYVDKNCNGWYADYSIAFARWLDMDNVAEVYLKRDLKDDEWRKDNWDYSKNSKKFFEIKNMKVMD